MPPTTADITTIEAWFRENFPEYTVASQVVSSREVVLFRAHEEKPGAPRFELEVSYEAFEDHTGVAIATDLTAKRLADRLRHAPAVRLMYDRRQTVVETDRHS